MGNHRNEFKGCKHLQIPLVAAMPHLRTVNHRSSLLDITQLGQRKGIADDVLGDILDTLGVSRLKPHLVKYEVFFQSAPGVLVHVVKSRDNARSWISS